VTTATTERRLGIGPDDLLEYLRLLRDDALDLAAAEERAAKHAEKIATSDWQFAPDAPAYAAAVEGQINRALRVVPGGDDHPAAGSFLVEAVQDAIDVLEFAIERSDDAR
jgi:hypothetical protein